MLLKDHTVLKCQSNVAPVQQNMMDWSHRRKIMDAARQWGKLIFRYSLAERKSSVVGVSGRRGQAAL